MWKQIRHLSADFMHAVGALPGHQKLVSVSLLLLAFMYPGQNYYQTLIIRPGEIRSYAIPDSVHTVYPVADGTEAPGVTAQSVVVQDVASKTVMYEKNPDTELLPASTTKVMTALVALDHYQLDDVVTIHNEDRAVGSTMELVQGEMITVENLIYGLLVESGNDAALALADNYPGGYDAFIAEMNAKAKTLHLDSTIYKNVSGIESYGHVTTARDLAVLAAEAVQNPVIERVMQTKDIVVTDIHGTITHPLVSTNQLLGVVAGMKGLKTGWTERAGECLISYVEREGRSVIVVVLNSADRFGESAALIDWVYGHHAWEQIVY